MPHDGAARGSAPGVRMTATLWQLWIDESGDFEEEGDRRCVAGLLTRGSHRIDSAIRIALGHVRPRARFPHHATELRRPIGVLVEWYRTRDTGAVDVALDETACAHALACIEASVDPDAIAFRDALQGGRDIPFKAKEKSDVLLKHMSRDAYEHLRWYQEVTEQRMRNLVQGLAHFAGPGKCFLVAAAEASGVNPADGRDAYLVSLAALLERAVGYLRSGGAERHDVTLHIAIRGKTSTGKKRYELVNDDDVNACIAEANAAPAPPDRGDVRFELESLQRYDSSVRPGIVLADDLSNRLRFALMRRTWREVESAIRRTAAVEVTANCAALRRDLPAISAPGAPREAIHAAMEGRAEAGRALPLCGWPAEQARSWIGALLAARGGR